MNHTQIKDITHSYYRKLNSNIKKVAENFDTEPIHKFRVEYKKLRAFFRMLSQEGDKTHEIKISKKLKKSYHVLGTVRDLQLQRQRILEAAKEKMIIPKGYLELLKKEIDNLKPELSEVFLEKPVAESRKKTASLIPGKFTPGSFKKFIEKKWAGIYSIILSGHFSDDNIHSIRKSLKDIFYTMKEYGAEEQNVVLLNVWNTKDEQYFNQLTDDLGNFQDKCTALVLLKSYWLTSLSDYNRKILEQVKQAWVKDKLRMKRLLVKKLRTDIIPHTAVQ